jgi:hypothetical protein
MMSTHEEGTLHEYDLIQPHSFDLTLGLERQLELDTGSLPSSPAARPDGRPQSLHTHVLCLSRHFYCA